MHFEDEFNIRLNAIDKDIDSLWAEKREIYNRIDEVHIRLNKMIFSKKEKETGIGIGKFIVAAVEHGIRASLASKLYHSLYDDIEINTDEKK